MSEKFSKTLVEYVCDYESQIQTLFYFSVAILLLMSISLFFLQPGTPTYVVAVMDVFGLIVLTAFTGFFLYRCR